MFIGTLFIIASYGNSQDAPQLTNESRNVVFIQNRIVLSHKEE
jgi:hypothetical protein